MKIYPPGPPFLKELRSLAEEEHQIFSLDELVGIHSASGYSTDKKNKISSMR